MATFSVSESGNEGARKLNLEFEFGSTVEEAIEKFGADVVLSGFIADCKVGIQATARRLMKSKAKNEDGTERDYTDAEILAKVAEYKPGIKSDRTSDPMGKLEALLGKLSPEQKAAFLATLADKAEE